MRTVLHLERKFTSKTETFIINQINTIKNYRIIIGCIKELKNFNCNKEVFKPDKISILSKSARYLSQKTSNNLFNKLKEQKIDLIHTHYLSDALVFLPFTKKFNVPKICSAYGYDVSSFPNQYLKIPRFLLNKVFKHYNYILAMSDDMKQDIIKLGCKPEKIIVHYYGTDVRRFINPDRSYKINGKVKILSVGTVEEKKAQHLVIEALGKLKPDFDNFEYHIVGGDEYIDVCKQIADKYKVDDRVFFHGYVNYKDERLIEFYKNADIFTLPSFTLDNYDKEGIPGTIVEAMASGLPVISTYHAGIPYIIENEKEGLLVKERDVEALKNAILRLIQDENLRASLGKNAQKKALEELDLYKGTERLEKIYEMVIAEAEDGRQM